MRSRGLVRLIHRLEVGVSELAYVCTKTNFSHHQFVNIVKIVQSLSFSSSRFAETGIGCRLKWSALMRLSAFSS